MKKISALVLVCLVCCQNKPQDTVSPTTINTISSAEPAITPYSKTLPLEKVKMPVGFSIAVFAEVNNARSLAMGDKGTLFIGNRNGDKVYAVKDSNGDGVADQKWIIASGLNMPCGVAFKNGSLYVAEVSRILRFDKI
jgi:glucose/arabinose dehydrogenase